MGKPKGPETEILDLLGKFAGKLRRNGDRNGATT
jgi:hypothetical protein